MQITLPTADGRLAAYTLRGPGRFTPAEPGAPRNRIAYSAAHVVADARAAIDPWLQCSIDWDAKPRAEIVPRIWGWFFTKTVGPATRSRAARSFEPLPASAEPTPTVTTGICCAR